MRRTDYLLLAGAALVALGGYLVIGQPGRGDAPMATRQAELAAKDPSEMTRAETLARLERLTQENPEDPQPHFFIGELLRAEGREREAMRAYRSALRRDDAFEPALMALGDAMVRLSDGEVGADAARLYARAYGLDPAAVRAGFMAGLHQWQAGNRAAARKTWAQMAARLEPGSTKSEMLAALVDAATSGDPASGEPGDGAGP